MIVYQGIKTRNKLYSLCFANGRGAQIEVPIDEATGKRVAAYLEKFCDSATSVAVERGNDEPHEE